MLYNLLSCDPGARAPRFYEVCSLTEMDSRVIISVFQIAHLGKVTPPTTSRAERDNDPRIQRYHVISGFPRSPFMSPTQLF